jgi:hypothetical protein
MGCLDPYPDSESGSGSRGKKKKKMKKNLNLYLNFFNFLDSASLLQLIPTQYTFLFFSSAAEPHHIDAAPAPCINFDAAPTVVRILLHC